MAEGGSQKIGGVHVEVGAKITGLQEGMKQAEATTKQTAQTMGESAKQAGEKIDTEVSAKVAKSERLVLGLQKAFKALILPVSIVTGMAALTARIVEAQKELFTLQEAMAGVSLAFANFGKTSAEAGLSPLEKELRKVDEAAAKAKEDLDAILQGEQSKRGTLPGAVWARMWKGSIKDIEDRHDEAMDRIYGQQQRNRERAFENDRAARAKAAAEADAKMWDDLRKQREDADKDALKAIEDRRKANEKAMQEQVKAMEAMTKMAGQYAAELSAAFSGAVASNRAASDAMMERMATSVNRLKEIAESNRQAQNRGDTSTAGGVW